MNRLGALGLRRKGQRGFTLVELLVVLAILAMIAAVAAPRLFKTLGSAQVDAARVQIESLSSAIDLYRLETGKFPPTLAALVQAPAGATDWNGPYLRKRQLPKDPWDRDYVYQSPGAQGPYDIYSLGADGTRGGEGENADILSWE